jgi:hypothetical protein
MFTSLQHNELFKTLQTPELRDAFRDLDTLLQGENALYVRPGNGHLPSVPFRIPEVTLITSPAADGAHIIDSWLERELQLPPDRMTIAGEKVRHVGPGAGNTGLYYGNVAGRLVVTDLPQGIRDFTNGGKSLGDASTYKETADASGLPHKTQGFLYVDIHSSIPLVETLAHQRIPGEIRRNLKPLNSAIQYGVTRSHELQVSFFLLLK